MRVRDPPSALKFKVFRDLEFFFFFCLTNNEPRVKTQPQNPGAGRTAYRVLPAGRRGRGYPAKPYQCGPRRRRSSPDSGVAIRNKPGVPNAPGFSFLRACDTGSRTRSPVSRRPVLAIFGRRIFFSFAREYAKSGFDHAEFWRWAAVFPCFISSYEAPTGFVEIARFPCRTTFSATASPLRFEKVFASLPAILRFF